MKTSDLSQSQLRGFSIVERVCSVLSLVGCIFIIVTFCLSKSFHKPINRLVFYASFGNMMTNVATLMARSYLGDLNSAGCQFQAFLIQMFMPADAFWTLAMAVNVYLTFYYKFDSEKLRKMEIPYLFFCYGIPFIIALTYVFVKDPVKGRMYGNATLWCWVSGPWDIWRIATFYGPVWVVILITIFIYGRAGREIYDKHKQLRNFSSHHEPEAPLDISDPFASSKTTEVFVTSEVVTAQAIDLSSLGRRGSDAPKQSSAAYSVSISANNRQPPGQRQSSYEGAQLPIQGDPGTTPAGAPPSSSHGTSRSATMTANSNRSGAGPGPGGGKRTRAAYEASSAAWSYTKCAILFFTAMLVTWIPSSANRVFSVVHVDEISVPLEYMSAFVLPLQGFWNVIIYIVTSRKACQTLVDDVQYRLGRFGRRGSGVEELVDCRPSGSGYQMSRSRRSPKTDRSYESESMTELASPASRPGSHEAGPGGKG